MCQRIIVEMWPRFLFVDFKRIRCKVLIKDLKECNNINKKIMRVKRIGILD